MLPTKNDAHVDSVLTNILLAYRSADWIWPDLAPIIDTGGRESDKYYIYNKGDWLRNAAERIAPGAPAPISGFRLSSSSYSVEEYGISAELPDRVLDNADAVLKQKLRQSQATWVTDLANRKIEVNLAAVAFASSWGTNSTSETNWDVYDTATPIDDIEKAKWTVMGNTGLEPNTLVLGAEVWKDLKRNPEVLDMLGSQERGVMTTQTLAGLLDLKKILVGKAVYNTANEGVTTPVLAAAWGQNALLVYVPDSPGLMVPSAMYTFQAQPLVIRRWREDNASHRKVEFVESSIIQDSKITGSDLGYYFSGIVS